MIILIAATLISWLFGSFFNTISYYEIKDTKTLINKMTTFAALAYSFWMTLFLPALVGVAYRFQEDSFYLAFGALLVVDILTSKVTVPLTWYALKMTSKGAYALFLRFIQAALECIEKVADITLSWYMTPEKTAKRRQEF